MNQDLTKGNITKTMLIFAFPMMVGNMLQQLYNVVDTLIVGQFLGAGALAAVGSSYTLMTFLTSILLGLCMGSGTVFSICSGKQDFTYLRSCIFVSFTAIAALTLILNVAVFAEMEGILLLLQVPDEIYAEMKDYLWVIFWGITASFLYNYFASFLRALGNSVVPLIFLGISAVLNIGLDLVFILIFHWGVKGAAGATVMAAFAAAVKIDSFAYMPVQDFGTAFSTFIAQNYGAGKRERMEKGIKSAVTAVILFCAVITCGVCFFAKQLMLIFVRPEETEILSVGMRYLRIEGAFYWGIGILFLLYGFYRAVKKPGISLILTIVSLGTRVFLAYTLSAIPAIGVTGIWVSIPVGWVLADVTGLLYYLHRNPMDFLQKEELLSKKQRSTDMEKKKEGF